MKLIRSTVKSVFNIVSYALVLKDSNSEDIFLLSWIIHYSIGTINGTRGQMDLVFLLIR